MESPYYRFGAFLLDVQARELARDGERVDLPLTTVDCLIHLVRHRDRPVGRDELAAAVWGRADVSEVSLTHAIMRLRRVLGDAGSAQTMIRTVPRHGYRWVGTLEPAAAAVAARATAVAADAAAIQAAGTARTRRIPYALATAVLLFALALVAFALRRERGERAPAAPPADSALVLPVEVDADEDSAWLRIGLMDLIAERIRRGGLATTPSETVLAMAKGGSLDAAGAPRPAAWLLHVRARRSGTDWSLSLSAQGVQRTLDVEAQAADPLAAARVAADEWLIKLGRAPPADSAVSGSDAEATRYQHVNAALLSGQVELARRLLEPAPAAAPASPAMALARARVAFFSGDYDDSRRQLEALLARLPADAAPVLRARALNALGSIALRQGRYPAATAAYDGAIALLQPGDANDVLATAYLGSGATAAQLGRLERAVADYGRARTLYGAANDPYGVATVDLDLAIAAMQRARPADALPLLEGVRERLRRFAADDALGATEIVLVEARLAVLDLAGALADSADFVTPAREADSPRLRWQLRFARAAALTGSGRFEAATSLLARLRDAADPALDAVARDLGEGLAARIALERGDAAAASALAAAAMTPALEQRSRDGYVQAWLTRILALAADGNAAGAAAELARLRDWNGGDREAGTAMWIDYAEARLAARAGEPARALAAFEAAMAAATARGIPEELVRIGLPYVQALLAARRLDDASAIAGRIAPWAEHDARAAWAAALAYRALGQARAADTALARARALAGERRVGDGEAPP